MRGHRKGLLTGEVEVTEPTNKDKIVRHKKVRASLTNFPYTHMLLGKL